MNTKRFTIVQWGCIGASHLTRFFRHFVFFYDESYNRFGMEGKTCVYFFATHLIASISDERWNIQNSPPRHVACSLAVLRCATLIAHRTDPLATGLDQKVHHISHLTSYCFVNSNIPNTFTFNLQKNVPRAHPPHSIDPDFGSRACHACPRTYPEAPTRLEREGRSFLSWLFGRPLF